MSSLNSCASYTQLTLDLGEYSRLSIPDELKKGNEKIVNELNQENPQWQIWRLKALCARYSRPTAENSRAFLVLNGALQDFDHLFHAFSQEKWMHKTRSFSCLKPDQLFLISLNSIFIGSHRKNSI